MSQTKKRAALYARFSSDLQKDRSIDDQFAVCHGIASRGDWKVVTSFSDRAKSGASTYERDGIIGLLRAASEKKFDCVIAESLERLSRDTADLSMIFKQLKFYGIPIYTTDGEATSILVNVRGMLGSQFLETLARQVKRGMDGRARAGLFPGSVPYGYRTVLGKPGVREIDPAQAKVVRRIYREYANGVSPRVIAAGLNRDGIPAPGGGGKVWHHQCFIGGQIKRGFIGNPVYAGEIVWNSTKTVRHPVTGRRLKRLAPEADRIITAAPHMRIVDQALYDAANKLRQQRGAAKYGPDGKVARNNFVARGGYLLAGLLRCGACGGNMRVVQLQANGNRRVACAAASGSGTCDHGRSYNLHKLTAGLVDGMRERLLQPKLVAEAVKAAQAQLVECSRKDDRSLDTARRHLEKVQAQVARIVEAIADSDAPVKELTKRLNTLEDERAGLIEQVRLLEAKVNVVRLHPQAVAAYCKNIAALHRELAQGLDKVTEANIAAFRAVFDSVVVHPVAPRAPLEFTPYAQLGSFLRVEPLAKPAKPGASHADNGAAAKMRAPISLQLVCLGRWLKAA